MILEAYLAPNSIVAVHGIGADPKYAWVTGGVNWLEDRKMLPAAVPNARILQFGYDSRWWGWKESKRPVRQRLENIAQSLLQDLAAERAVSPFIVTNLESYEKLSAKT